MGMEREPAPVAHQWAEATLVRQGRRFDRRNSGVPAPRAHQTPIRRPSVVYPSLIQPVIERAERTKPGESAGDSLCSPAAPIDPSMD